MAVPLIATFAGAFAAGLAGSVHCALMCGPLACAGLPVERSARLRAAGAWHLGRIAAYALLGCLLGGVGLSIAQGLSGSVVAAMPWVMAAALVATAFDVGRWIRPPAFLGGLARRVARLGAKLSPALRAGALGAATPLLPCGLLYGVFLAAMAAGSFGRGAGLMASFAVGGTAALSAAQLPGLSAFSSRPWLRRTVLLCAAGVLVWRAIAALQAGETPPQCH